MDLNEEQKKLTGICGICGGEVKYSIGWMAMQCTICKNCFHFYDDGGNPPPKHVTDWDHELNKLCRNVM